MDENITVDFLVNRMHESRTNYLSFHRLTLSSSSYGKKPTYEDIPGYISPCYTSEEEDSPPDVSSGDVSSGEVEVLHEQYVSHKQYETLSLDDFLDDYSYGGECRGLLYFDQCGGRTLIFNPTTEEMKFLPPSHDPDSHVSHFGSGFGYGANSEDFKIVRIFQRQGHSYGPHLEGGLYEFWTNSWKDIKSPPYLLDCNPKVATHVNGTLYWIASFAYTDDDVLLSFDLAKEEFSTSSLPFQRIVPHVFDFLQTLCEVDGKLASIVYLNPVYYSNVKYKFDKSGWRYMSKIRKKKSNMKNTSMSIIGCNTFMSMVRSKRVRNKSFTRNKKKEIYKITRNKNKEIDKIVRSKRMRIRVREEGGLWEEVMSIPFEGVVTPLGMQGHLVFLEKKAKIVDEFSQLHVYNLVTNKMMRLHVHDYESKMQIFPYIQSLYRLPDAEPMDWYYLVTKGIVI